MPSKLKPVPRNFNNLERQGYGTKQLGLFPRSHSPPQQSTIQSSPPRTSTPPNDQCDRVESAFAVAGMDCGVPAVMAR